MKTPIVDLRQFIQAIRDAGYRGTGSAISELIDNAFEADATRVDIEIVKDVDCGSFIVYVKDDGHGMRPAVLKMALQFGGSSRFGRRVGAGRFGMGLPNSSVNQARRLEVYTWASPKRTWWSYLDVDEISLGRLTGVPEPKRRRLPQELGDDSAKSGTVVVWRKCDRLSFKREASLLKNLHKELGQVYRMKLWEGQEIFLNGVRVLPRDPLFLRPGDSIIGAKSYGSDVDYEIKGRALGANDFSKVTVRFSELPVSEWASMSNREKRNHHISKNAGVSILRAGREIDYGWFFMGKKRKENYDDWWRCELEFQPDLDELFGVTHTKQGITPKEVLLDLLSPDMEAIAHRLNARVREKFIATKELQASPAERRAAECDKLFPPPETLSASGHSLDKSSCFKGCGLSYKLTVEDMDIPDFYVTETSTSCVTLTLNKKHPFCSRFYNDLDDVRGLDRHKVKKALELTLFAAARAESTSKNDNYVASIATFRKQWSDLLSAFLS